GGRRPRDAAAAAAHHVRAGEALRAGGARRSGPRADGAPVVQADGRCTPDEEMSSLVASRAEAAVTSLRASAYTIPAESRESDGTFEWDSTTLVVVELEAEGERGLGWTYGAAAAARLAEDLLAPVVSGCSVLEIGAAHGAM